MLGVVCMAFSACGNSSLVADVSTKTETTETEAVDASENSEGKTVKVSLETEYADNYPDDYEDSLQKDKIVIYEDNTAVYTSYTKYTDSKISSMEIYGTVEESENGYMFTQRKDGEYEPDVYTVTIENGELVSVNYFYQEVDLSEIAGEYTGVTGEFGTVTLRIADNKATLITEDGRTLDGSLYLGSYGWDFYYSNYTEVESESDEYIGIDWIVEFGDGTFTYKLYAEAIYEQYAGEYKLNGDLGEFTVSVNKSGDATATVMIDGVATEMTGGVRTDYDEKISGFYLSTTDGFITLNLDMQQIVEGEYNYYGSIVKELRAG